MPFAIGDLVQRRDAPDQLGTVLRVDEDPFEGFVTYQVRFGSQSRQCFDEDLLPAETGPMTPWEALASGRAGPARDLSNLLTYERLRRPMGPVGNSFGTARVKLFPFQFKPLVKFLDSPTQGLLIADEVGLGKTIEAGYIIREWGERQSLETILILVPARLRVKWRDEMKKRFDLDFDVVGRREVRQHLKLAERAGRVEPFRWIASYESLREPELIDKIAELSPSIDLLVMDEAHRVRNRSTNQYRLARTLRETSLALLLLTATPVQTSLANLHTLLDLIQPDAFGRPEDFEVLVEANRPILSAMSLAAAGRFQEAAEQMRHLNDSWHFRTLFQDPSVQRIMERLAETHNPSRGERVQLQAAIGELSLTGHLVSRTRKTQVFEDRAVRKAYSVTVPLSDEERQVYDAVHDVTALLLQDRENNARTLAALTGLRYTASSIVAGHAYMRARLERHGHWLDFDPTEDEDELDVEWRKLPADSLSSEDLELRIAQRLAQCPTPERDSKLIALRRQLRNVWQEDDDAGRAHRKVVVFSFFKRTLSYLSEQLDAWGWSHEHIDGSVPLDAREERIERFLSEPEVQVLLSSEVGGEGLDMQRACVVVNYDLPWNPMVVEQRIGRVDRIGQESDTITIINLIYEGTIEDRILDRLYWRVDLYTSSVGELEDILGSRMIQELVLAEVTGSLSDSELLVRIENSKLAAERARLDVHQLTRHVDGIVSADQGILDQLERLVSSHRLPTPSDIATLLQGYLAQYYPGSLVDGDPVQDVAELSLAPEARRDLERWSMAHRRAGHAFLSALRRGPVRFTVDGDVALRHPRAAFIQPRHPAIQFGVHTIKERAEKRGGAYRVQIQVPGAEAGGWLVGLWTLTWDQPRPDAEVVAGAVHLESGRIVVGDAAEGFRQSLMSMPRELGTRMELPEALLLDAGARLRLSFARERRRRQVEARETARLRAARRRATWEATLGMQVERARDLLRDMTDRAEQKYREGKIKDVESYLPVRGARGKLTKREAELATLREELALTDKITFDNHEIAVVFADVLP